MLLRTMLVGFVGLVVSAPVPAQKPDDKPKIKFEIHRAETKPVDGLTPAMVEGTREKIYLHKKAELTSEDIAVAKVTVDNKLNPAIDITFTKVGAVKIAKLSEDHLDKPIAFVADDKVIYAPIVRAKIGESAMITGSFSKEEAEKIVKAINEK